MPLASVSKYATSLMTSRLAPENRERTDKASPRWDEGEDFAWCEAPWRFLVGGCSQVRTQIGLPSSGIVSASFASLALHPSYPLHSPRLALRPVSERDVEAVVSYRSRPEVCRYVPFEPMDATAVRERVHGSWARHALEAEGEALLLGVEITTTGELIGDVLLVWRSAEHRGGEIGYVFHPAYAGHGYATEAMHRLLHLAFDDLGLHRVIARVDADNQGSARLVARLGMRQEAHLVRNEWFKGRWSEELDFAILEDEWRAMPHNRCLPETSS